MRTYLVPLAALALLGAAPAAPVLAQQQVGTMTAFQTLVSRVGEGTLAVGAEIFLGDHLVSNETGLGMIVFDDESSAKIGPNAELFIDEFVYDPTSGAGSSTIQLDAGLLRLYGGQISKNGGMRIVTPHVVLGVRGGIADAATDGDTTIAVLRAGILFCIAGDVIKIITNEGFGCTWDGALTVSEFPLDIFEILDSLDENAGDGTPGGFGGDLDTAAICASPLGQYLPMCQSSDGGLPGGGGGPPDTPAGSCAPGEVLICSEGCYCSSQEYSDE